MWLFLMLKLSFLSWSVLHKVIIFIKSMSCFEMGVIKVICLLCVNLFFLTSGFTYLFHVWFVLQNSVDVSLLGVLTRCHFLIITSIFGAFCLVGSSLVWAWGGGAVCVYSLLFGIIFLVCCLKKRQ